MEHEGPEPTRLRFDLASALPGAIRELRLRRKMTQEQLAEAATISIDQISLIERGKSGVSFSSFEKLSRALKLPVSEFFLFEE